MTNYLTQYREAIRRGEIRAGYDMIDELDRLIADLDEIKAELASRHVIDHKVKQEKMASDFS